MILRVYNGGVLEVFWRQPSVTSWSYVTALNFLTRFKADRQGLRGLRQLLCHDEMPSVISRMSDEHVLRRGASLISKGQMVVAQYRFTERWPGTGVVLGSRHDSVLLLWRDKLDLIRDATHATKWLQRIAELIEITAQNADRKDGKKLEHELDDHKRELRRLRTMAVAAPGVPDYSQLENLAFLAQIQRLLLAGDLIPIYHRPTGHVDSVPGVPLVETAPAQRAAAEREEVQDPVTFTPNHEANAQAGALIEAAKEGVPFCEVCAKAARGEAA